MENNQENDQAVLSLLRFLSTTFKGFSISVLSNNFSISQNGETIRVEHARFFSNCDKLDLKEICILIQNSRLALSEVVDAAKEKFGEEQVQEQMRLSSGTMHVYNTNSEPT